MGIFPNFRDENKKYLSSHHPVGLVFIWWTFLPSKLKQSIRLAMRKKRVFSYSSRPRILAFFTSSSALVLMACLGHGKQSFSWVILSTCKLDESQPWIVTTGKLTIPSGQFMISSIGRTSLKASFSSFFLFSEPWCSWCSWSLEILNQPPYRVRHLTYLLPRYMSASAFWALAVLGSHGWSNTTQSEGRVPRNFAIRGENTTESMGLFQGWVGLCNHNNPEVDRILKISWETWTPILFP